MHDGLSQTAEKTADEEAESVYTQPNNGVLPVDSKVNFYVSHKYE